MELWTGVLSWWKCHWADLKSAGLFRRNLFLNSLKTICPINSGVLTSLLFPHLSSSPTDCLPSIESLMPLKNWCSIHARWLKSSLKHSIRFCGIFSKFKTEFYCNRSSKMSSRPDCMFEIHQLWQSDFSRVYSNCCCSCSFEPEILKIDQSSHKMYINNIVNFQESKTVQKCLETYWMHHVPIVVSVPWMGLKP